MKIRYALSILISILFIAFGIYQYSLEDYYRNTVIVNSINAIDEASQNADVKLTQKQKTLYQIMPDEQKSAYLSAISNRQKTDSTLEKARTSIDEFVEIENKFEKLDARADEIIQSLQQTTNN